MFRGLLRDSIYVSRRHYLLSQLENFGMTGKLLDTLLAREVDEFSDQHIKAFKYLRTHKHLAPEVALQQLRGIDGGQANGVANGMSREDVVGLNDDQIRTYLKWKCNGLTVAALLKLKTKGEFSLWHGLAISYLIETYLFSVDDALTEISQLNGVEADGLREGLRRCDVIGLGIFQTSSLAELKPYGLTADLLRNTVFKHEFSSEHASALKYLLRVKMTGAEQALAEIKELDMIQAIGIAGGIERIDVVKLTDVEIFAVNELYKDFDKYKSTGSYDHLDQRRIDVSEDELSILLRLKEYGISPIRLKEFGFTKKALSVGFNICYNPFYFEYCRALLYLIEKEKLTVDQALSEVKSLTKNQANEIAAGRWPKLSSQGLFAENNKLSKNSKEVPDEYVCPIAVEIMQTPVLCVLDGISYEHEAIKKWLSKERTSPVTRAGMKPGQQVEDVLILNRNLQQAIERYRNKSASKLKQ